MKAPNGKHHKKGRKANKIGRNSRTPGTMNGARVWDRTLLCWLSEPVRHAAPALRAAETVR